MLEHFEVHRSLSVDGLSSSPGLSEFRLSVSPGRRRRTRRAGHVSARPIFQDSLPQMAVRSSTSSSRCRLTASSSFKSVALASRRRSRSWTRQRHPRDELLLVERVERGVRVEIADDRAQRLDEASGVIACDERAVQCVRQFLILLL